MSANSYTSTPAATAVAAQLRGEIAASGTNRRAIAVRLDRHYETLRRYLVSERALPMDDLLAILDVLGLEWGPFMGRAEERHHTSANAAARS